MKKIFTLLILSLLLCRAGTVKAQTTLAAGDIAFIGFVMSPSIGKGDAFAFITLKALSAGTVIYFTDDGWNGSGWVNATNDVHFSWSPPAEGCPIGTIVTITGGESNTVPGTPSIGTCSSALLAVVSGGWYYSSPGDEILAYQSSSGAKPSNPTFIAGIQAFYNALYYDAATKWCDASKLPAGNTNGSVLPIGLTNGVNCVSIFNSSKPTFVANCRYNASLTGTASEVRALINNYTNWTGSSTTPFDITTAAFPTPSITAATAPGAPTIGTATAGDGQASVTFTAPASDGGSAITGYTVTSNPGAITGTGPSSPITVSGLTNGTAILLLL